MTPLAVASWLLLIAPLTNAYWSGGGLVPDPTVACRKPRRSRARLLEMCRREPALLREVSRGVAVATAECQQQFVGRRWNCTMARRSLKKVLLRDNRETSFVTALMAAGVTMSVTRACSTGDLIQCGCDKQIKDTRYAVGGRTARRSSSSALGAENLDWEWGGCGDNVQFGARKSRVFMDASYRRRSGLHALVRLHNHAAGRLAVKLSMRRECKCHGLSGSCTLRTCWWKMPPFREIGTRLKDRFDGAVKVVPDNDGRSFFPESPSSAPPRREDLVYVEDSPDFCRRDPRVGSLGTQGRTCNASSPGLEGCDLLCCGRGFDRAVVRIKVNCKCKFVWCCEVNCSSCIERRVVYTCR